MYNFLPSQEILAEGTHSPKLSFHLHASSVTDVHPHSHPYMTDTHTQYWETISNSKYLRWMCLPGGILEVYTHAHMLHGIYSVCAIVEVFVHPFKINNKHTISLWYLPTVLCSYRWCSHKYVLYSKLIMALDSQKSGDYCSWLIMHRGAVAIGIAGSQRHYEWAVPMLFPTTVP